MQIFLFFILLFRKNAIKIHRAVTITATAPLLNLNLNYEKLRHKDNKFYQIINLRQSESLHI